MKYRLTASGDLLARLSCTIVMLSCAGCSTGDGPAGTDDEAARNSGAKHARDSGAPHVHDSGTSAGHGNGSTRDASEEDGGATDTPAMYALVSVVFTDDGRTTYVNTLDSLDISAVELDQAREFPGIPEVQAAGGKLYLADGESPKVTRFSISDDGRWQEDAALSFANYTSEPVEFSGSAFVRTDKAYQPVEIIDRVLWDPDEMKTIALKAASSKLAATQDGLAVRLGYDHALTGKRLFQPFYWSDDDFVKFHPTSVIAVYDTSSDATSKLIDAPCPMMHIVSADEDGNLYFSNGAYAVPQRLVSDKAPATCMVRIKAGEDRIDESFTLKFADVTDGREASTFRYLGHGLGFLAVYHQERADITAQTDPGSLVTAENWRFWLLDVTTRKASPVDGIDYFGGQPTAFTIDGRTLVFLPSADYASTTVYEVFTDGTATKRFKMDSWAYNLVKVR